MKHFNIEIKYCGFIKGNSFSCNMPKCVLCDKADTEEVKLNLAFKEVMIWLIIKMWYSDFNFYI